MRYITTKRVRVTGWIASPFVLALIIYLSFLPPSAQPSTVFDFPFGDKIAHMVAYFVVAFTFSIAFVQSGEFEIYRSLLKHNRTALISIFIFIVCVGAAIEIVQPLMNRSREFLDLIFDAIGTFCGLLGGSAVIYGVKKGEIGDTHETER